MKTQRHYSDFEFTCRNNPELNFIQRTALAILRPLGDGEGKELSEVISEIISNLRINYTKKTSLEVKTDFPLYGQFDDIFYA